MAVRLGPKPPMSWRLARSWTAGAWTTRSNPRPHPDQVDGRRVSLDYAVEKGGRDERPQDWICDSCECGRPPPPPAAPPPPTPRPPPRSRKGRSTLPAAKSATTAIA